MHLIRFLKDKRGVSAVEFALIAPWLILLYCGMAVLTLGFMAERRAGHVAYVVADLVTQYDGTIQATELDDIFMIGGKIMEPFAKTPLKMVVTSFSTDANKVVTVDWSRAYGGASKRTTKPADFPTVVGANESIVLAEVDYTFNFALHKKLKNTYTFHETSWLRPRVSSGKVGCNGC